MVCKKVAPKASATTIFIFESFARITKKPATKGKKKKLELPFKQSHRYFQLIYSNCSCLEDPEFTIRQGPCNVDCYRSFILFLVVQCLIQLIGCSGRITTVLVNYRSVDREDKTIAQGLALFLISLLAFIPGPIIFGRIIGRQRTIYFCDTIIVKYLLWGIFCRQHMPGLGQLLRRKRKLLVVWQGWLSNLSQWNGHV